MKINFKKLAMAAGVTAAMAAGSMSAHAVITAVPAPAQLVPLFYFNADPANHWDTDVRITVPKAVGADSVIGLLTGQRNGSTNIALDTSWNTNTGAFVPTVIGGNTVAANQIHWFWMNNRSEEIANGIIPVTPDDSVWISAENLAMGGVVICGKTNSWADQQCAAVTGQGGAASGQAGYLILSNQSAFGGGAPQFAFAADAWVENEDIAGYPDAFSIPVLGLADDVDTTSYVTPTNNLIQNYPASAMGPIASPIHTGIRTSSTVAGFKYRVVDLPIHNSGNYNNTLVAWVDTNAPLNGAGALIGNGASGRLFGIGANEEFSSLPSVSLPNQLNIVRLGWGESGYKGTVTPEGKDTTMGITNTCKTSCTSYEKAANPAQVAALGSLGAAANGGFLKFVLDTKALPNNGAGLAPGAYSSMIMFNVPSAIAANPASDEEAPMMGVDTGFFTNN